MRFLSDKIRIEILLPLYYNDKTQIEPGKFLKTRNELTAKFGGCTVITPAEGSWIDKGIEYNDINSGFYVIAPHTEDSIRFFQDYKEVLKKRFNQLDILITYYPIKNI
jgi:hypothetical protein